MKIKRVHYDVPKSYAEFLNTPMEKIKEMCNGVNGPMFLEEASILSKYLNTFYNNFLIKPGQVINENERPILNEDNFANYNEILKWAKEKHIIE